MMAMTKTALFFFSAYVDGLSPLCCTRGDKVIGVMFARNTSFE